MRRFVLVLMLIIISITACSLPFIGGTPDETPSTPAEVTNTPAPDPSLDWPPVTGPDPSPKVAAFYYPWYFNLEVDGRWDHWGEGQFNPPDSIASDYYPVLGAYSESDPEVLAQHFAWLREAGVGLIVSSWWGRGEFSDQAVPLILDIADHYGIKVAFHIEPYGGRTDINLLTDIRYIYKNYGDHPAFFWTNDTSLFSPDDQPKGLFFMWASVASDLEAPPISSDYWQEALDTIHAENPGAIVLTDQNDPAWILDSHFDGSYNYGVLDADEVGYKWASSLPTGAWYVPGINPGFSARRIGYEAWVDTPRRDGATYDDRWERMFAVGIEPAMVAITTFNEWHEGTQIEPAVSGKVAPGGYEYLDYESLQPEGYLAMTRDWAEVFLAHEWPDATVFQLKLITSSDWTDLYLTSGASWQGPLLISSSEEAAYAGAMEGHLALQQPLDLAESGNQVEAVYEIQLREDGSGDNVVFTIERGGLGVTWVELYRNFGGEWVLAASFKWAGHAGGRNAESFNVARESLFGD